MATRYHPMADRPWQAVERDGWFVGFVERRGKRWIAYTCEGDVIGDDCTSSYEAATRCWNERPRRRMVKMSRLLAIMREGK